MKSTHKLNECVDSISAKNTRENDVLKRKFVPVELTISNQNQRIKVGAKLPFKTNHIHGVLTATNVEIPSEVGTRKKYYTGFSTSQIEDDSFLELSNGASYNSTYPPDILIENVSPPDDSDDQLWWYFAYPETDILPFFLQSKTVEYMDKYFEIDLVVNDQEPPQKYFLISDRFQENGLITFEQIDQTDS